jgi:hypothetical protein
MNAKRLSSLCQNTEFPAGKLCAHPHVALGILHKLRHDLEGPAAVSTRPFFFEPVRRLSRTARASPSI